MSRLDRARDLMIRRHLKGRGITDSRVLAAMEAVPREAFVQANQVDLAYEDGPLPAGEGQTISQPYIVALMISALQPGPDDVVLDVGAGTGYAAAVLSRLVRQVYAIEYHEALADKARDRCRDLGYDNIRIETGDGSQGWPAHAPFQGIHVAACTPSVPHELADQLADSGRLVLPLGSTRGIQRLVCFHREQEELVGEELESVRFVPLISDPT